MEFSWDILSSRFHSLFVKIAGFFLSSQWTVLEGAGSSGTTSRHPSLPEPSSAPLQLFPEEAVLVFSTVLDFSPFQPCGGMALSECLQPMTLFRIKVLDLFQNPNPNTSVSAADRHAECQMIYPDGFVPKTLTKKCTKFVTFSYFILSKLIEKKTFFRIILWNRNHFYANYLIKWNKCTH